MASDAVREVKLASVSGQHRPMWSPSPCAGDVRCGGDAVSPRTHSLLISNSKSLKHRGIWKFHSQT